MNESTCSTVQLLKNYPLRLLCARRLDSEIVAMDSDGYCTVVACRDGSVRLLGSVDDYGGFMQVGNGGGRDALDSNSVGWLIDRVFYVPVLFRR